MRKMKIAFTGTRKIDKNQSKIVWEKLATIALLEAQEWHVGDAMGVDAIARMAAARYNRNLHTHVCAGNERWQFAARSKRMVDAIATDECPKLFAFADKLCPEGCKPCKSPNGQGSGTWLTVAYARYLGISVEVTFLESGLFLPSWLNEDYQPPIEKEYAPQQLSLF
jgi:hypothetical protein